MKKCEVFFSQEVIQMSIQTPLNQAQTSFVFSCSHKKIIDTQIVFLMLTFWPKWIPF